ncbi:hypothetical protein [Cellulomonas soli]|uniref:Uncharacterized protein n=1 Tax=Cellulomonas soli TaxID=931535 RepID=A0A512PCP0_9CELL|nr:hypothetical protein [Cellulomonas soli]NYI58551.1 hypothetical protein [Cellulomonas soli]GEP68975.1 hypothetical protein CSO01_16900 [Cellulomonas soli]
MVWVALCLTFLVPALVMMLFWSLFPTPDETPRWRTALAGRLDRLARRLRRERHVSIDPFLALHVQERLGAVADHVQELERDPHTWALAERVIASQLAYDQLLAEACRMAGVEVQPHAKGDPAERFREEVELASRGWAW